MLFQMNRDMHASRYVRCTEYGQDQLQLWADWPIVRAGRERILTSSYLAGDGIPASHPLSAYRV